MMSPFAATFTTVSLQTVSSTDSIASKDHPAVDPTDVTQAMHRIRAHVRTTPIIEVRAGELGLAFDVTLKLELMPSIACCPLRQRARSDLPA
jgi:hypothetical protein